MRHEGFGRTECPIVSSRERVGEWWSPGEVGS